MGFDMLSKEQQDIIENSVWVVNAVLKQQGLQGNCDLRQSALLYMCRCLEKFDPQKNIKWTTYAYKNVYLHVKRLHRTELAKQSHLISDDIYSIEPVLPSKFNGHQQISYRNALENIKKLCTPAENRFIELKLLGYKRAEISKIMQCSTNKIDFYMQNIKRKARKLQN